MGTMKGARQLMIEKGTLYLCATPIGNLQDITLRVLETLKKVDLIACEDTRKTLKLLNHFEIAKPVTSYYEHNKTYKGDQIIQQLLMGKQVALVSDAGMPGVSDPGYDLIKQCLEADIPFTVLPGAVAAITGLVLSGLPTERFAFEGFIPRSKNERLAFLNRLSLEERTMIFYEAPHRLLATLEAMEQVFGLREIAVTREMTKKFEEVVRGSISEVIEHFTVKGVRGEFAIILHGAPAQVAVPKDIPWAIERVHQLEESGISQKDAIKQAAKEGDISKRDVYNAIMALKDQ